MRREVFALAVRVWFRFRLLLVLACLLFVSLRSFGQATKGADLAQASVPELIETLTKLDSRAPGVDGAMMSSGFLADAQSMKFDGGVLGLAPVAIPPEMRELVVRGPAALPALLTHLSDRRPTRIVVGNQEHPGSAGQVGLNVFMFQLFADEYDPRVKDFKRRRGSERGAPERSFAGSYTVKVGDLCFALVGQIVNRRLLAVRYQPSAGLVVNSPIETPALAEQVRRDWGAGETETLRASLRADIRLVAQGADDDWGSFKERRAAGGFERLRLYFPKDYQALTGEDLMRRMRFEAAERQPAK